VSKDWTISVLLRHRKRKSKVARSWTVTALNSFTI